MPYVSIKPGGGFGNQLFQIAAMLGYAERHGHTPVFIERPQIGREHRGSAFDIRGMFSKIPLLTKAVSWEVIKEPADAAFSYIELPGYADENVLLEGYFQSERYGPVGGLPIPAAPVRLLPALISNNWSATFFLHVRRADYLHPANTHHRIDLGAYYRACVRRFPAGATCFVVSDDMAWCRAEMVRVVAERRLLFCPEEASDAETFFWMTSCAAGGICANSTFSWWAAAFVHRLWGSSALICMPAVWGRPPLPPARDIHTPWATVVDV
jgi:hypothetical protein